MNKTDAKKIIASLMVTYPNYNPMDTSLAAEVWADTMEEYTYEQVSMALKIFMKTNTSGFAPTPAQLIEKIQLVNPPTDIPNAMEAWSLVSKALRNSAYNSEQEFTKLPPLVQKAVGSARMLFTWATDEDYNETVIQSLFVKEYRPLAEQAKEISKLPESTQQQIATKTPTVALTGGENENVINLLSVKDRVAYSGNTDTTRALPPENIAKSAMLKIRGES